MQPPPPTKSNTPRRTIDALVQEGENLPSLAPVYQQLTDVIEDPDSSLDDIGTVIKKDPTLTARLLRLSNSAFYGFAGRIETIEQGLQRIGFDQTKNLAFATCVIGAFKDVPEKLVNPRAFWRHSIACGVISSLIGKQNGITPEKLFVGGLVHDIGRLVMYIAAPKESQEILTNYQRFDTPTCKAEREILGFDHTDLGCKLMEKWRTPATIINMICGHHNPQTANTYHKEVAIIHAADFITTALCMGNSGEAYPTNYYETVSIKGLTAPETHLMLKEAETQCQELCSILTE